MNNAVIENSNQPASMTTAALSSPQRAWDLLFAVGVPAYFGYEYVAMTNPSLPHPLGGELLPLVWMLTRQGLLLSMTNAARLAAVACAILSTLGAFVCSLAVLRGVPVEQMRYELSVSLGTLWRDVPLTSLLVGLLALGACHLGGVALCRSLGATGAWRQRAHDLYFGVTALIAHLTIVRYAGGPFFL